MNSRTAPQPGPSKFSASPHSVSMPPGEEVVGILLEHVAAGPEVVVHDVEDHRQAQGVRPVDEPAEVVGGAVFVERGEQEHAVISPAERAVELGDGHDLQHRDAQIGQVRELGPSGRPGPFGREGADVQLVEHLALGRLYASPSAIGPALGGRIDDLGRAMQTLRLISRRGIGQDGAVGTAEPEGVARPRGGAADDAGEVAIGLGREPDRPGAPGPDCSTTSTVRCRGTQTRKCTPPEGTTSAPTGSRRVQA